jgi:hypothetical protein
MELSFKEKSHDILLSRALRQLIVYLFVRRFRNCVTATEKWLPILSGELRYEVDQIASIQFPTFSELRARILPLTLYQALSLFHRSPPIPQRIGCLHLQPIVCPKGGRRRVRVKYYESRYFERNH